MLAKRQAEQAGEGTRVGRRRRQQPSPGPLLARGDAQRRLNRGVGEAAQSASDLIQVPEAAKVAQRHQKVQLRLQPPQSRGGLRGRQVGAANGAGEHLGQGGGGIGLQQPLQPHRVAHGQARQVGGGGEHGRQRSPLRLYRRKSAQPLPRPLGCRRVDDRTAGDEGQHSEGPCLPGAQSGRFWRGRPTVPLPFEGKGETALARRLWRSPGPASAELPHRPPALAPSPSLIRRQDGNL